MSCMDKVALEQDVIHWIYRGEGAANLVLAYTGQSSLFVGKVLRIQKVTSRQLKSKDSSVLSVYECLLWKDLCDTLSSATREIVQLLYVENVMIPLLGSQYVDAGIWVNVSRSFLESIEKNVYLQRPAGRIEAAQIDFDFNFALLLPDHSIVPRGVCSADHCICVELKPKCGFLPSSRFIADENAVKKSISRFKMHQFLKFIQKEISQISGYDPLDLFSLSKDRVHEAIKALFTTPQNNLRVLLNGVLIYGDSAADHKTFESSIAKVQLSVENLMELISETLLESQVLDSLLRIQKLDSLDIEGAIHAYYEVISQPCKVCRDFGCEKYSELHSVDLDRSVRVVRDYLIAATAKDCSLMISFWASKSLSNADYIELSGQRFDYKVSFIDLDMKALAKMEQYYELDQKIVRCFAGKGKFEH